MRFPGFRQTVALRFGLKSILFSYPAIAFAIEQTPGRKRRDVFSGWCKREIDLPEINSRLRVRH